MAKKQIALGSNPASSLCVTYGNLFNVSELSFLIWKMGIIIPTMLFDMRHSRDNTPKHTAQGQERKRLPVSDSDCY